jgi:hypothetical protein
MPSLGPAQTLEQESARLKRIVAEQAIDISMLKVSIAYRRARRWSPPSPDRDMVPY